MSPHLFLFTPGRWLGEGKISFSGSPDIIHFCTSWEVNAIGNDLIAAVQRVEMLGSEELLNNFTLSDFAEHKFKIQLENELVGSAQGLGLYDEMTIAWEFRHAGDIEGFEVYERQPNGDYLLHAEYSANDLFRTSIDGHIWKK